MRRLALVAFTVVVIVVTLLFLIVLTQAIDTRGSYCREALYGEETGVCCRDGECYVYIFPPDYPGAPSTKIPVEEYTRE